MNKNQLKTRALYKLFRQHPEVTTDSRRCPQGSMFFALKGESFDGNRFAAQALEAGAAVAVVDDPAVVPAGDERYVLVADALAALQQLAALHRGAFQGHVIQVTGTNGKTTTKELLAAVLGTTFRVLYTEGNLNNHIGVPLTLLRLKPGEHEIAVIETGANHPGEIAALTQLVRPNAGLITNVGRAHLQGFGSFEGVKQAKGELYDYLLVAPGSQIFYNEDDPDLLEMLQQRGAILDDESGKFCSFAHATSPTVNCLCDGHVISNDPFLCVGWRNTMLLGDDPQEEFAIHTNLIGAYNLDNILMAITVGLSFGVSENDISEAIALYQPSLGRSEYRRTATNELIIDAYNANLTSMIAALKNFRSINHAAKMVILGDMKELGGDSENAHLRVAAEVIGSDIEVAWFVGPAFTQAIAQLPQPQGLCIRTFPDVQAVVQYLNEEAPHHALILIKGSNSTRLHQLPPLL